MWDSTHQACWMLSCTSDLGVESTSLWSSGRRLTLTTGQELAGSATVFESRLCLVSVTQIHLGMRTSEQYTQVSTGQRLRIPNIYSQWLNYTEIIWGEGCCLGTHILWHSLNILLGVRRNNWRKVRGLGSASCSTVIQALCLIIIYWWDFRCCVRIDFKTLLSHAYNTCVL